MFAQAAKLMPDETDARRVLDWLLKLAVPLLLAHGGWLTSELIAIGNRVTAVEHNRYTERDAVEDRRLIGAELTAIRKELATVSSQIAGLSARLPSQQR